MKKIFRMALVIALAGASLMYTGCTKDYDAEIKQVTDDLTKFQQDMTAKVTALEGQVSTLNSAISSLESAYKAADAALQKAIDANAADIKSLQTNVDGIKADLKALQDKVAANEAAIKDIKADLANYATKKELADAQAALEEKINNAAAAAQAANDDLKAALLEKIDALQAVVDNAKAAIQANADAIADLQAAQDAINEASALLANELRSIVFIPDLYVGGVEAVNYAMLAVAPVDEIILGEDFDEDLVSDEGAPAEFADDAKIEFIYDLEAQYALPQIAHAYYNINPSSFDPANAEWVLYGYDKDYIPVRADEETWSVEIVGKPTVKDGVLDVPFVVKNAEYLPYYSWNYIEDSGYYNTSYDEYKYREQIGVMNLEATLKDGKTINSDYEAIYSQVDVFKAIAFKSDNRFVTNWECACPDAEDKELYWTAMGAVENPASVDVQYNGGPVDLYALLDAHMLYDYYWNGDIDWDAYEWVDFEEEVSFEDLEAAYPGIEVKFELVPYTLGGFVTSEDAFGKIDGNNFIPCYWDNTAKKSIACGETEDGISAVGRKPVVLVTIEKDGKVLVAQYFKINIVKEVVDPTVPEPIVVVIPEFADPLPFICDDPDAVTEYNECGGQTLETTWKDFTYYVLETGLKLDYAEFIDTYTWEEGVTYIKNAKGEYVDSEDVYGTLTYVQDETGHGINDKFIWTICKADAEAILEEGGKATVYAKFADGDSATSQIVYVQFTASIAEPAKAEFGEKIKNEWYEEVNVWDIDAVEANTVHMNVYVPTADQTDPVVGGDVTVFDRALSHYFVSYAPKVSLKAESEEVYGDILEDGDFNFSFTFAASQTCKLGTQKFYVSDDKLSVFADSAKKDLVAFIKPGEAGADTLVYAWAEGPTTAKALLNKYGSKVYTDKESLYFDIDVAITYGDCAIPAGDYGFHVRPIRPLDINLGAQDISKDGDVDGNNVYLAQFLSEIVDWNDVQVIKKTDDGFETNVVKGVDMFVYYQFSKATIDLSKVQVNNWSMSDPAKFAYAYDQEDGTKGVKPEMKLAIGTLDEDEIFTAEAEKTLFECALDTEEAIDAFNSYVINYRNDEARIGDFQMKLPISVEYAWGSYEGELVINVVKTN